MKIELVNGDCWSAKTTRINVYHISELSITDGYIDCHKVVEIEALTDEYFAVRHTSMLK
jgi:hypothetical protein